jgi:hypothetical protein
LKNSVALTYSFLVEIRLGRGVGERSREWGIEKASGRRRRPKNRARAAAPTRHAPEYKWETESIGECGEKEEQR